MEKSSVSSSVLILRFEALNWFICFPTKRELFVLSPDCVELLLCLCSLLVLRLLRVWMRFILSSGSNNTSIQRRKELSANFLTLQKRRLDTTLRILAMELKLKLLLQVRNGAGTCEFSLFSMHSLGRSLCCPVSSIHHRTFCGSLLQCSAPPLLFLEVKKSWQEFFLRNRKSSSQLKKNSLPDLMSDQEWNSCFSIIIFMCW